VAEISYLTEDVYQYQNYCRAGCPHPAAVFATVIKGGII